MFGPRIAGALLGATLALALYGCSSPTTEASGALTDASRPVNAVDTGVDTGIATDTPTAIDASASDANVPDANALSSSDASDGGGYAWNLPPGFPLPSVPAGNPMSASKVELGRHLFYDARLSGNGTESCASCHQQALAFTDGLAHAVGSTGAQHPRSAMSLANVGYASTLTWANPLELALEDQALVPMFGDDPVELGLPSQDAVVQSLGQIAAYPPLFAAAWPADPAPLTFTHVVQALASFERTLVSGRSPYDRFLYGDTSALSDSAQRGYQLFNSETLECFHCHVGFDLTDHVNWAGKAFFDDPYHNTGLYNIDGMGAYPEPNTGVFHVTRQADDMGKFKAPTLRNIAITAPYMHDGSIATLDGVVDHYQAGGRTIPSGPYAGDGNLSPLKDALIRPLQITDQDRADLIAFLRSLTDDAFLTDPKLASPW